MKSGVNMSHAESIENSGFQILVVFHDYELFLLFFSPVTRNLKDLQQQRLCVRTCFRQWVLQVSIFPIPASADSPQALKPIFRCSLIHRVAQQVALHICFAGYLLQMPFLMQPQRDFCLLTGSNWRSFAMLGKGANPYTVESLDSPWALINNK